MTPYVVRGVERPAADLAAIDAPGGVSEGVAAPDSLRTWVDEHVSGSGGAALAGLVALLRERGYLSHGLSRGRGSAAWMASLPGYAFQPSASGHSLARIDALFGRLLERETDPRAEASGNYVAAVGDDEQFAVAVALIAVSSASQRGSWSAPGSARPSRGCPPATTASAGRRTSRRGPRCSPRTATGSPSTSRRSSRSRRASR